MCISNLEENNIALNDKYLDNLFKSRFHGAANISGIRYQILYTIYRAFDLLEEESDSHSIVPEGVEDIDLISLSKGNEYIQVKYSSTSWTWSKLKDPIKNFIEAYKESSNSYFVLAVNFKLEKDLFRLAQPESVPSKDRMRVEKKFLNLCVDAGLTRDNFRDFLSRFTIVSMPENELLLQLKNKFMDIFVLSGDSTDIYTYVFVSNFLDWAVKRQRIFASDLKDLDIKIKEKLSRENEFQAYGKGLIDRLVWNPSDTPDDFIEGKKTRPGHVADQLDVIRPKWLKLIDAAVQSSKICVIKSSSGQGKSTLMYRYAYENWLHANIYILNLAESYEQAEQIRLYLKNKADLGLPLLLLIDNVDWRTRFWPSVARECADLGVRVILTVRNEDWHRYSEFSQTNLEVVEPELDINEAQEIFELFRKAGKLHSSAESPKWAYEKIGEPPLLMEYVYLITHGRMLEERLREQICTFIKLNEDRAKLSVLRKVVVCDSLGAPIILDKLENSVHSSEDFQYLLNSLNREYLTVDAGKERIFGYHWVRSNHLLKILHENYLNPARTALDALELIPLGAISSFVSHALSRDDMDREIFVEGLLQKSKDLSLREVLFYLDGLFEAGEKQFFESSRVQFDEAFEFLGNAGISLLGSEFLPTVKPNILESLLDKSLDIPKANIKKLKDITNRVEVNSRGFNLCRPFLEKYISYQSPENFQNSLSCIGLLLDWFAHCNIAISFWKKISEAIVNWDGIFDQSTMEFCRFAYGLFRTDEGVYYDWLETWKDRIYGYLKLHVDCIRISVADKILSMEFIPLWGRDKHLSINDQAVNRLKKLRYVFPFCDSYQSRGVWVTELDLIPSVDESIKNISRKDLHLPDDIDKNVVWRNIFEDNYRPDSYYRFQKFWIQLRQNILLYLKEFSTLLRNIFEGKKNIDTAIVENGDLSKKIYKQLYMKINLPKQAPKALEELYKTGSSELAFYFKNFFNFLYEYFNGPKSGDKATQTKRLLVSNYRDSYKRLKSMHSFFHRMFEITPDYFQATSLNGEEVKQFSIFSDLLDALIVDPIKPPQKNIFEYIRMRKEGERKALLRKARDAFAPLEKEGVKVILPQNIFYDHPLRYFPIAYSVSTIDLRETYKESLLVITALRNLKEISDYFWLIPVYNEMRIGETGFRINKNSIEGIINDNLEQWETIFPSKVPNEIIDLLPQLPLVSDPTYELRNILEGIISYLKMLHDLNENVKHLQNTGNPYEEKLYQNYLTRIFGALRELNEIIIEAKSRTESIFNAYLGHRDYLSITTFLDKLKKISSSDDRFFSSQKVVLELDEFKASIERLFSMR